MNKKITYKEAIDMLNGLCEGLGDAFDDNTKNGKKANIFNINGNSLLTTWCWNAFIWECSPEKDSRWREIVYLLVEISTGEGCPKDKEPKPSENYAQGA